MPRKKRLAIIVTSVILVALLIIIILGFLYLKTDIFKSKQTLFAKYLSQNFEIVEELMYTPGTEIENTLDSNKYTSELTGKIEYTENINTSNENTDNPINDVQLQINSQTDKTNNYYYKDIKLVKNNENLARVEYVNDEAIYGIRLDGIKQFVSIDTEDLEDLTEELGIENLDTLFEKINFQEIFELTEQEKESLKNTYLNVLKENISKEKYYKQANSLITVNNRDVKTNAYYIKLTKEEYNNLYIKILEQISNDEIILSKIDKIEEVIKEKYTSYSNEEKLRENFKEIIEEKIEEIKDKNIGDDEVKITVYENDMKTIRTSIETTTNKLNIDLYGNTLKIDNVELGETENEQIIKIEKENNETGRQFSIEYEVISENEIALDGQVSYKEEIEENDIINNFELEMQNEQCKVKISINDNKKIVNNFEDEINLDEDNVELNSLSEEQINTITNILQENIVTQIENFSNNVPLENYTKMLQNLSLLKKDSIQISDTATVTETEKNRFNSQFEFFASQNLSSDNIKELIEVCEDKFYDMSIILNTGEETKLDTSKLEGNSSDINKYLDTIDEITIKIKENTTNENKKEDLLTFLEKASNGKKYDVTLEYNEENGLVESIVIKVKKS